MNNASTETLWYQQEPDDVEKQLKVDVASGLSVAEAASRLTTYGPNLISTKAKEPGWKAFLRQYQDFMQIVLVVAAVGNQIVTHERGTTAVLLLLTLFNAIMGLRQEAKAQASHSVRIMKPPKRWVTDNPGNAGRSTRGSVKLLTRSGGFPVKTRHVRLEKTKCPVV